MTTEPADDQNGEIINPGLYVAPVTKLLAWWDQMADDSLPEPDIRILDEILAEIKDLPGMPGRLGADIYMFATGGLNTNGDTATRAELIDALNRLRRVANYGNPD